MNMTPVAKENKTTDLASITKKPTLIGKFAEKYSIDADKLMGILKATAFKQRDDSPEVSNEQMAALLIVADQYNLNPFTKEIFAFPDKKNGIVPVVGVDGWSKIMNGHPNYDGIEFRYSDEMMTIEGAKDCPTWIEVSIYKKDISRPVVIREYIDEVYKPPYIGNKGKNNEYVISGPWQTHTKRQLRHKGLIQCARIAFSFSGIFDEDEARNIVEKDITPDPLRLEDDSVNDMNAALEKKKQSKAEPIESTSEVVEEKPVEEKIESNKEETADEQGFTLKEIISKISEAKTLDDIDLVTDLINSLKGEDQETALKLATDKATIIEKA